MTRNVIWQDHEPALPPVDEAVDHVRGSPGGRRILEYGDYECPYARQVYRAIERVGQELGGGIRFCFRHFPLTGIHPHALAAAAAAEAAARQGRFWDMHALLFHRQRALEDGDLRRSHLLQAGSLPAGLAAARFARRGLAGLIAWPAAEPVFRAQLAGAARPGAAGSCCNAPGSRSGPCGVPELGHWS